MFKPITQAGKLFKQYLLAGRHPAKVRIQNLLGKHFFKNGIMVKDEGKTILNLNPNDWLCREMLMNDGYENLSIALGKKLLKNGGLFIDIGANFGLYTLSISANKLVKVYAIEPNYMIIPWLVANVQLNKRNNVVIMNAALTDKFRFLSFELPQLNNLGSASFSVKNEADFSILSCSLNYIFQSQDIQAVELIKIDIEGNELTVLKDFSFEKYHVKNILLEFDNVSISFDDLNKFFCEKGFSIYNINGQLLTNYDGKLVENNLWMVNKNN